MKLHEFCSAGQKRHALLLTYAIQPIFFESVVLRSLIDGGADRIVVLADQGQVERNADAWPPPQQIGRRWILGKSAVSGIFHPKIIARIGESDAQVALLSGNLTSGGWGRNLEIGSAWTVGPAHPDKGTWFADLLAAAQGWTQSPAAQHLLREMSANSWLVETGRGTQPLRDVTFSTGTTCLIDRLHGRWNGQSFDHARVLTGSSDENGALLARLHSLFGVKTVDVFATEDRVCFLKSKLQNLRCKVHLWAINDPQILHAKLIHLFRFRRSGLRVGLGQLLGRGLARPSVGGRKYRNNCC